MGAIIFVAVAIVVYAAIERRLSTTVLTGPICFVTLGLIASPDALDIIDADSVDVTRVVDVVFQGTLVLLLFSDAASMRVSSWRQDASLPGRLLGIGLPLTIGLGAVIASLLVDGLSTWEAAIAAAIVAPTDAALGQAVISNPRVPARIREALDVESGLNDGISLPFVLIFIGLAEEEEGVAPAETFLREIGVAVAVGLVVGWVGAWLLTRARRATWTSVTWRNIAVIAVAVLAFVLADELGGSGFIATFVCGLTYGRATGASSEEEEEKEEVLASGLGEGLVQISFLLFGALLLGPFFDRITWQIALFAVLALTVARMLPVAISMVGAGLAPPTLVYLGWFGPRGLATVVFAALVVAEADLAGNDTISTIAVATVGLSVFAHGLSAYVGAERYADWVEANSDASAAERAALHGPGRSGTRRLRFRRHPTRHDEPVTTVSSSPDTGDVAHDAIDGGRGAEPATDEATEPSP